MSPIKRTDVAVADISITCINGHGDAQPLIMPAGSTSCTFWFYAVCDENGCHVVVCSSCQGSQ
jgi:hypothetical protein